MKTKLQLRGRGEAVLGNRRGWFFSGRIGDYFEDLTDVDHLGVLEHPRPEDHETYIPLVSDHALIFCCSRVTQVHLSGMDWLRAARGKTLPLNLPCGICGHDLEAEVDARIARRVLWARLWNRLRDGWHEATLRARTLLRSAVRPFWLLVLLTFWCVLGFRLVAIHALHWNYDRMDLAHAIGGGSALLLTILGEWWIRRRDRILEEREAALEALQDRSHRWP